MVTTIYLVRHAHSVYSLDEVNRPLSEEGFKDASQVSYAMNKEQIDIVVSSPYKRAIQTVEGIASHIRKEVVLQPAFRERKLSEEPLENFEDALRKVWSDEGFFWDGGESNITARQRGILGIHHILEQYKGKRIVIGTHGNIMTLIMSAYDPRYDFHFWRDLDMPDIYQLTFEEKDLIGIKRIWTPS